MNLPGFIGIKRIYHLLILLSSIACRQSGDDLLESFKIHPDFKIELAASEPLIFDPVDMEFDQYGNALVLEMPSYPNHQEQNRLVMLKDIDGDGEFDKRILFAEDLGVASSLLPYKQGVLVAAPPYLLYLKDTDGDDQADHREVLMEGFSAGNTQHNVNGLSYSLDGWIYMANGGNEGTAQWKDDPQSKIDLDWNDIRLKIEDRRMEITGETSGGFEITMDPWGNYFTTHNLEHISQVVFSRSEMGVNELLGYSGLTNISDHDVDGLSRIYPIGVQETRVNHPEQSGYFSGACGITYYGGGIFPPPFDRAIFVADVVLNLVHVDLLNDSTTAFQASRAEEGVDFLASTDRSFRPVNFTVGPDGSMYLLDMHREVIEHPEWIPDEIEEGLDLRAGTEKGRIYRISPLNNDNAYKPSFMFDDEDALLEYLGHQNQWYRMTAHRILLESEFEHLTPKLVQLTQSDNQWQRLHAFHILISKGLMTDALWIQILEDVQPEIQIAGLKRLEEEMSPGIVTQIEAMILDRNIRVRTQVLQAITRLNLAKSLDPATFMQSIDGVDDHWLRLAFHNIFVQDPVTQLSIIDPTEEFLSDHLRDLVLISLKGEVPVDDLLRMFLKPNTPESNLLAIMDAIVASENVTIQSRNSVLQMVQSLELREALDILEKSLALRNHLGLPQRSISQEKLVELKELLFSEGPVGDRVLALKILSRLSGSRDLLMELLTVKYPLELRRVAVSLLATNRDAELAQQLVERWSDFGPFVKTQISDFLIYDSRNHDLLLSSMESGKIQMGELNLHLERRRELLWSEDESIRERASQLFNDSGVTTRKAVLEDYKNLVEIQGDPQKGLGLFEGLCGSCHRMQNIGVDMGPNLTEISRKSPELLLHDILDPNAAVDTEYINHLITTMNDVVLSGVVVQENDESITLMSMGGVVNKVMRSDIKEFNSTGLSPMPEGFEVSLDPKSMADLIAYLQNPVIGDN